MSDLCLNFLVKTSKRVATRSRKSVKVRKTNIKTKVRSSKVKIGVFEKCQEKTGNLTQYEKATDFSVQVCKIPYFQKPSNSQKLVYKSDQNCKIF